jgi:hypothetical protein
MKPQTSPIAIGDRFTKAGRSSRSVYEVRSLVDLVEIPPHVRLVEDGQTGEMLMSMSALRDRRFWSRLESEAQAKN